MSSLFSAPSPPPLPPVPPPPTAAAADPTAATQAAEQAGMDAAVEEMRRAAGSRGRASTILAGSYDVNQPTLGARTLLGG